MRDVLQALPSRSELADVLPLVLIGEALLIVMTLAMLYLAGLPLQPVVLAPLR